MTAADRLAALLADAGEIIDRALVAEDPDEWYADGRACLDRIRAWAIEKAREEGHSAPPVDVEACADAAWRAHERTHYSSFSHRWGEIALAVLREAGVEVKP